MKSFTRIGAGDSRRGQNRAILSFRITPSRDSRRLLEKDVTDEFRTGQHGVTGGVDALVINRQLDVGMPPAQVLETRRGLRAIYVR